MKNINKLLSVFLTVLMLASTAVFTAFATENEPKYGIDFIYNVDEETATVNITVTGGEFSVGHVGFAYNTEVLTLITSDETVYDSENDLIPDVVIGETNRDYTIMTTAETNSAKNLIDANAGTILFAWYANTTNDDNYFVDAKNEKMIIATVNFALKEDIANSTNPAEMLAKKLNNSGLVYVMNEAPEVLRGWDKVYEVYNIERAIDEDSGDEKIIGRLGFDLDDDIVSQIITTDISKASVTTSASGIKINVSWDSLEYETEEAKIKEYKVSVIKDGVVVAEEIVVASEENLNAQNKYAVKIEDDDIEKNTKYTVKITPVTINNKLGVPVSKLVSTYSGGSPSTPPGGGGAGIVYTVTFSAGEGSFAEGQKFKYNIALNSYVTETPEVIAPEGKVFAGWSVDGVNPVDLATYKITKDITFTALYSEKEGIHNPYINGYPGGEVRAEGLITRAETATIISRISGNYDSTKAYTSKFTDIDKDHWAYNYVSYAYENGIVIGYEDNSFAPDGYITRAEFATIIQRYFNIPINEYSTFVDVEKDHWAIAYIGACKDANLIIGYENGEFRPENKITRAEAVTIINRALGRTPTAEAVDGCVQEKGIPFIDLDTAEWYFYDIMEAAIKHIVSEFHK